MDINIRIRQIRIEFCNDKNKDFAIALNEPPNKVNNWIRSGYSVGLNVIEKILTSFPTIDANWLISGKGEMLKEPKSDKVDSEVLQSANMQSANSESQVITYIIEENRTLKEEIKQLLIENTSLKNENQRLENLLESQGTPYKQSAS